MLGAWLCLAAPTHAQITWDTSNSDGAVGDGSTWADAGNWIGGALPGSANDVSVNGGAVTVDSAAVYRNFASGGGTVTVGSGGTLTTHGTFSAVRYLGGMTVQNGGLLVDAGGDDGSIRSATTVETGGRVEGFTQVRDNALTLNGGVFAPLGTNAGNYRRTTLNASGKIYIASGKIELDAFGDDDCEYFDVVASSAILNLAGTSGGTMELIPQGSYVPAVGDSYDLWDNSSGGTVTPGDASNVTIAGCTVGWDTSQWASSGILTISSISTSGATTLYAQDFQTDRTADFNSYPSSFHHDPSAVYPGTQTGAMVFGAPGDNFVTVTLRVAAQPGESYEVITRSAILGSGSNTADQYVRLLDAGGATLYSSADLDTGDKQALLPATGVAPTGTAWIQISWTLRGLVATGSTRRIEIYQVHVTQLGASGPRPFMVQNPYINHVLGYVGNPVSVDMTDSFDGSVTTFSNDAGIPMTVSGQTVTFTPTATRPLKPGLGIYASNSAGQSLLPATIYLQVLANPATLAAASPDPAVHAQSVHQYVEPGQVLFPLDCDHLFTGGLPPFDDALVSAPSWVEMPVDGLVGGRCPNPASPTNTTIVIERTDARGHTAQYTVDLSVIAARSRTPVATPTNSTALKTALDNGEAVIQLVASTNYSLGNMYGSGLTTTTAQEPTIILGASGATVNPVSLNTNGHYIFENVDFVMPTEDIGLAAKKVRGLRLVNCTFQGVTIPVDLNDGTPWVKTDTFRYGGNGLLIRENSYVVLDGCYFTQFNTAFGAMVTPRCLGIYDTVSETVADDHVFLQQCSAIWFENVDLIGHGGNHTSGEHRDIIQLANPNMPPVKKVLLRRVFGLGEGQSQSLFMENETQRILANRLPNYLGNHRDLLVEHCVFVGNSAHGISVRGNLDYEVRNSLTIGHPDEFYMNNPAIPAYGPLFMRQVNENGMVENNIADTLAYDDQAETANTNNVLSGNLILSTMSGGYTGGRTVLFPDLGNTSLPMYDRLQFDPTWATANPGLGPDMLR